MVLTVSKETGCGDEVCKIVADELKYRIVNDEITQYAALMSNMPHERAKKLDDRNYSHLNAFMANNFDMSLFSAEDLLLPPKEVEEVKQTKAYEYAETPSGDNFFQTVSKVVQMFAYDDNIIIVGRGGNFILKNQPNTLHVRFVAPLEMRTKNIMSTQNIDAKEAKRVAEESDVRKGKYMKHYFKEDTTSPANYNIIINLGNTSVELAAKIILGAIKK